jgi:lipid-A-disaccharide synthase-like uncharacterized protein
MALRGWLPLLLIGAAAPGRCPTCGHVAVSELWITIGFLGQALFTARFLAQWVASERRRDSVVPVAFWWLSLGGGVVLLTYAAGRRDPVIVVGQAMGIFIYVRNLMLYAKGRRRAARRAARAAAAGAAAPVLGPHRLDAAAVERRDAGASPR